VSKVRVLVITLLSASFLMLAGCVWSETSVRTVKSKEANQSSGVSAILSDQTAAAMLESDMIESDTVNIQSAAETTELSAITTPIPVSAADISSLPAGSIVDDFLVSQEIIDGCFYYEEIPNDVFVRMDGNSYKEDCTVPLSDLRYVRVLYCGFDSSSHTGELVVGKSIAEDITEVFRTLYAARYPIGKMVLVDEYGGDDNASMLDNNTSAFNYRIVNGTTTLSRHSQGMAIDINPLFNPWVYTLDGKNVIDPPAGSQYADRSLDNLYYIDHEDLCYRLLTDLGFEWGGDWSSSKDYQHFSKDS